MKPITTEKAIRMIELENTITFVTDKRMRKEELKKEIENLFNVKVEKTRTQIKGNKKYVYFKLNKKNPAIDLATKLGVI